MPVDKISLVDGRTLRTHDEQDCLRHSGLVAHCSIHAPSDHPLKDAPANWWHEARHLTRVCPHGIEHPDPDDMEFKAATLDFEMVEAIYSVHLAHCDGCCRHLTAVN